MKVLLGAELQKERDRCLEEENGVLTEEIIDYQKTKTGIKGTLSMKVMVEMEKQECWRHLRICRKIKVEGKILVYPFRN